MRDEEKPERSFFNSSLIPHPSSLRILTLLTDFGTADYFVGAMKGVILSANPLARLVDISHEIPPQDVRAGAFTLLAAYREFPEGTIHVAVVDPGVGSSRRPLVAEAGRHFFVGPDNGIFSHVLGREAGARVFHVTKQEIFRQPVSNTFHGRDVFAPVAAELSRGARPEQLGEEIKDFVLLEESGPKVMADNVMVAHVIHVDRFGNCITDLTREHLPEESIARGVRLTVNGRDITSFRRFFAEEAELRRELFAIYGSAGFLEIAAYRASAAAMLDARSGQEIIVTSDESSFQF